MNNIRRDGNPKGLTSIKISTFEKQFIIELVIDEILHLQDMDDGESKDASIGILESLLDKLTGNKQKDGGN